MRFFICAYEGQYQGTEGIIEQIVANIANYSSNTLNEIGKEMGAGVVESFALNEGTGMTIDEYIKYYGITWEVYPIRNDITLTTEQLDYICYKTRANNFIKEYCEEPAIVVNNL